MSSLFPDGMTTTRGSTDGTWTVANTSTSVALFLILLGNQGANIQCLISNQRERSGRIHCHRSKNRINIIPRNNGPHTPAVLRLISHAPSPGEVLPSPAPEEGNGSECCTGNGRVHVSGH